MTWRATSARPLAQAGRAHAVTIATNMAGRGTDIVLGGNPPGLARLYLERLLLPRLSEGTDEADEVGPHGFQHYNASYA